MARCDRRVFRWSPQLAVALWCLFIGIAAWQHAQRSEQPPIHDAQTYFQKAQNFWQAASERRLVNPLDLEPTFRPPGTVLMSYPFGFDLDFRGFYFRSVFWPVLLLVLAVYVAAHDAHTRTSVNINLALGAMFLISLPILYQFEFTTNMPAASHFGLVDNFLTGLAALAVAASLRSLKTRSLVWVAVAAAVASLCLLVKPSGAYIMALVGASWLLLALVRIRQAPASAVNPGRDWAWLIKGAGIFAALYAATLGASFSSRYLSPQNLAFGKGAMAIMQAEWSLAPGVLHTLIQTSTGYALPAVALMVIALALLNRRNARQSGAAAEGIPDSGLMFAALAVLAFGIWFWVSGSGGLYVARYFVPFAAMAAIYALPVALSAIEALPRWQTVTVRVLCVAPALNLGLLLGLSDPPAVWQKWSGVNLSSGVPNPVLEQARRFVSEVAGKGGSVKLYAMDVGLADATYQAVADHYRAANPGAPRIIIRRPIDWIRPSAYRMTEILGSDFILLDPVEDPALAGGLERRSIESFDEERLLFQAWATGVSGGDGVRLVSTLSSARLLRIEDRAKLEAALSRLEARHRWRKTFLDANPRRWWSERELARELAARPATLANAGFGGQFKVKALSVASTDVDVTVMLWWERLDPHAGGDWYFFVHALNEDAATVLNEQISLTYWEPITPERRIRHDVLRFRKPPYRSIATLGVGIYRPSDGRLLHAEAGRRDWNDTRVMIPLR